jgi:hypothetical protein
MAIDNGIPGFLLDSGSYTTRNVGTIEDDCWHSMIVSRDVSTLTFVHDGVDQAPWTNGAAITQTNSEVGADGVDYRRGISSEEWERFPGDLSHFFILNRAMTAIERATLGSMLCACGDEGWLIGMIG